MEPNQSLEVLIQGDVLQRICQQLTFEEAVQFAQTNKNIRITCPIQVKDGVGHVLTLNGVNSDTVQTYNLIKGKNAEALFVETVRNIHNYSPQDFQYHDPKQKYSKNVVRLLLNAGINPDSQNNSGETALMWAANNGLIELAEELLKRGADPSIRSRNQRDALFYAIYQKRTEMVRLLLEYGAPINPGNILGRTNLMAAAENGSLEIARMLIEKGENIHAVNFGGNSALFFAIKGGNEELVKLLLEKGANVAGPPGGLLVINAESRPKILKLLLDAGADPNPIITQGVTLLAWISDSFNSSETSKMLVEAGANPNVVDRFGRTPLYLAVSHQNKNLTKLLLDHGADPNIPTNQGNTPLLKTYNIPGGHHYVKLLLEAGADPNFKNQEETPPLIVFMTFLDIGLESIRLLLEAGADVNATDKDGNTPLMIAIQRKDDELIALLREYGA